MNFLDYMAFIRHEFDVVNYNAIIGVFVRG
jgi:hypothetical protein